MLLCSPLMPFHGSTTFPNTLPRMSGEKHLLMEGLFPGLSCASPLFTQRTLIFIFCSRVTMLTQAQSVNLGNLQILFHRADAQQTFCIRCLYSSLSPLRSVHFSLFSLNHVQFFSAHFIHLSSRFWILIQSLKMMAVPLCLIFTH